MRVDSERATPADALEKLRDSMVKAGRQGSHLLVNLDKTAPDFKNVYTDPAGFKTELAFNRNEWRKEEVHKAVLKEAENYSNDGGSNVYFLRPEHTLSISSNSPDVAVVQDALSKIPCIEQFKFITME